VGVIEAALLITTISDILALEEVSLCHIRCISMAILIPLPRLFTCLADPDNSSVSCP
jgi:hypothetical protein